MEGNVSDLVRFRNVQRDMPFFIVSQASWVQRLLMVRDDGRLYLLAGVTSEWAHWWPVNDGMCRQLHDKDPCVIYAAVTNNEALPYNFWQEEEMTRVGTGQWLAMPLHFVDREKG